MVRQKDIQDKDIEKVIKALEKLIQSDMVLQNEWFVENLQNIINRLQDQNFRVAVVGEFSSGKSTFLNAIIGKDILKHGAKETTATITEILNDVHKKEEVFDVYYENGDIEEDVSIDHLQEYTATSSKRHQVAQEIRKVVIKGKLFDSEGMTCLVDTPGLNGVADYHREKTIEQIKNAHACIYLLQVRGLGQSDIEFIRFISKYQHNIIFVQNFIDELKELEGETPEEKLCEQKRILEERVFFDNPKLTYSVVGISARKALIARTHEIEVYEGKVLDDATREKLYEESQFQSVLDEIAELIEVNEKNSIQKRDTVAIAIEWLKQFLEIISYQRKQEEEEWNHSLEGKKKKNLVYIQEELQKNKIVYQKNIDNFIVSESVGIRKVIDKMINSQLQEILQSVKMKMDDIKTIDGFEAYRDGNKLAPYLYDCIMKLEDQCNEFMNRNFENLLCNTVLRIEQYTGTQSHVKNLEKFEMNELHTDREEFHYEKEENDIIRLNEKLAAKRAEIEGQRMKQMRLQADIQQVDYELKVKDDRLAYVEREKRDAIRLLGQKPEAETRYETEVYYEDRGGFGILDALLGPKKRKRTVSYLDDSEQREWLNRKARIENDYREKQDEINADRRFLAEKRAEYEEDVVALKKMEPQKCKEAEQILGILQEKEEYLAVKKKNAEIEYLNNLRKALIENVQDYLMENVAVSLSEIFEEGVCKNQKQIQSITKKIFLSVYEERIRFITDLLNEGTLSHVGRFGKQMDKISETITIMEEYLCQN